MDVITWPRPNPNLSLLVKEAPGHPWAVKFVLAKSILYCKLQLTSWMWYDSAYRAPSCSSNGVFLLQPSKLNTLILLWIMTYWILLILCSEIKTLPWYMYRSFRCNMTSSWSICGDSNLCRQERSDAETAYYVTSICWWMSKSVVNIESDGLLFSSGEISNSQHRSKLWCLTMHIDIT